MDTNKLYRIGMGLAIFTIVYNIIEGLVSVYFGYSGESFTLFGFGIDSFIEALSAFGIAQMIVRTKKNPDCDRSKFEKSALYITGVSFYLLMAGLILSAVYSVYTKHKPETTIWGIVISVVSIGFMWALIYTKMNLGKKLNSDAMIADAKCARVCMYMSLVLLASSGLYAIFKIPYIDAAGSLGLAYFSFMEAKECFEKAKGNHCRSCGCEK
jgi:divalent metal cation (Fe/Co/Zn/Cd) transporter